MSTATRRCEGSSTKKPTIGYWPPLLLFAELLRNAKPNLKKVSDGWRVRTNPLARGTLRVS